MNEKSVYRVKYIGEENSPIELIAGNVYQCLGKEHTRLRVIDETGEDYLYPEKEFIKTDEPLSDLAVDML